MPHTESQNESGSVSQEHLREVLFLAQQSAESGMKVLPGSQWSLHYPEGGAKRADALQGLLDGRYEAADVADHLKPDALLFDMSDIPKLGIDGMTARIRELTATAAHGDYRRFAEFVVGMRGKETDIGTLQSLYDGATQSRTRGKLLDSLGAKGQTQIKASLHRDAEQTVEHFDVFRGMDRVLQAMKMRWMERRGLADSAQTSRIIDALNQRERALFDRLADAYAKYADRGDEDAFKEMVTKMRDELPAIQEVQQQMSPETEKLRDELEPYMDQATAPGSPGDTAIPQDDQDEYHTPPPSNDESQEGEKGPVASIFDIAPSGTSTSATVGYYASGRKSYYDVQRKTWSKRKRLTPYDTVVNGDKRQTISGKIEGDLKSLPIPAGHCLDASSLKWEGAKPQVLRDQKGCFYLQPTGACSFSVDFLKESSSFGESPIAEDLQSLTNQPFGSDGEAMLGTLNGDATAQAQRILRHVRGHHYYPGGGDPKMAQALQHKLRTESTGEEYVGRLDASEYLECYSSNTLFVAYCRRAGIPARLVVGHKIDGARGGKASITASTGHAWSEFWDGNKWHRIDATPPAKPDDKKEEKKDPNAPPPSPSEEADDGGMEQPPDDDLTDQVRDKTNRQMQSVREQMEQAGDGEVEEAEKTLEEAEKTMDQMQKKQQELQQRTEQAESFSELENIKRETERSDLEGDMKESVDAMREAKEKQMKKNLGDLLDEIADDGFLDQKTCDKMKEKLEDGTPQELDNIKREIEREEKEFREYDDLREEVMPLVEEWYRYFAKHLPRQQEIEDDDLLSKRGRFNRRAAMRPGNLLYGTVRNARVMRMSMKPRFIASILVDVSGSMEQGAKLKNARKLLVFYSELFTRIGKEFGYIRFNINTFSDSITQIKAFDQDYDSPERYDYPGGGSSTVKVRLMRHVKTDGGTNMLDALKQTGKDLDAEVDGFPDHASALYFIGDGGDTCGNKRNIRTFLNAEQSMQGFGSEHMRSAVLLGSEAERQELSELFGERNTTVAGNFDALIETSMLRFAEDIEDYCKDMSH